VGIEPGTSRTRRDVRPTRPWRRGCSVGGGDRTRRRLPPPGRADTGPGRGRKSDLTSVKPAIYPPKRPQARGRTWGLPPPAPAKHSRGQQMVYSSIPLAKLSLRAARAGGWCGTTYNELRCRARRPPPPGGLGPGPGRAPGTRQARAQKEAEPGN
jgi:hypothetical protein